MQGIFALIKFLSFISIVYSKIILNNANETHNPCTFIPSLPRVSSKPQSEILNFRIYASHLVSSHFYATMRNDSKISSIAQRGQCTAQSSRSHNSSSFYLDPAPILAAQSKLLFLWLGEEKNNNVMILVGTQCLTAFPTVRSEPFCSPPYGVSREGIYIPK